MWEGWVFPALLFLYQIVPKPVNGPAEADGMPLMKHGGNEEDTLSLPSPPNNKLLPLVGNHHTGPAEDRSVFNLLSVSALSRGILLL